ncbi:MAG: hypothetical protein WCF99_11530 [Chloroflexales bacterium]
MAETESDDARVALRIPKELHAKVVEFSKGNGRRPKSSINATLVFLIRAGLAQQRKQASSENPEDRRALQPALA